MVGNIKAIITQAQNDLPNAGVVVYDCNQHDVFYTPQSEMHYLRERLSTQDRSRFDAAQAEYSDPEKILVVTFHNNKLVDLATYDGPENLSLSCPI